MMMALALLRLLAGSIPVERKRARAAELAELLGGQRVFPSAATNARLADQGVAPLSAEATAEELLRRPDVRYAQLQAALHPVCGMRITTAGDRSRARAGR